MGHGHIISLLFSYIQYSLIKTPNLRLIETSCIYASFCTILLTQL